MSSNIIKRTPKTRAWTFPTSPRVPYGIIDDLKLLKEFEGSLWNEATQLKFAKKLSESNSYKGSISKKETAFAARDRTRTPKLLGLIKTHLKGKKAEQLFFTEMGNEFIKHQRNYKKLFERQVLKVQYPNSTNNSGGYEEMNIRPATFLIKILLTVGKLTKTEIKTFCITQTRAENFHDTVSKIKKYREDLKQLRGKDRKEFKHHMILEAIEEAYKEDIASGNIVTREGEKSIYKTKINYLNDFGDTCSRMMVATGIFTFVKGFFCISESKLDDAKYYLDTLGVEVSDYDVTNHETYVMNYMGSSAKPILIRDNPILIEKSFKNLYKRYIKKSNLLEKSFYEAQNKVQKEKVMDDLEIEMIEQQKKKIELDLVNNIKSSIDDIDNQFTEIVDRQSEIINAVRPVYFEWNTWRSLIVAGGYKRINGNFDMDVDGVPSNTAAGKLPDIVVEYESFWMIVEVTLMQGHKQFEAEFEPITRHLGKLQKDLRESGDPRPVYGIFMANKINETIYPYLRVYSLVETEIFGGRVNILPLNLDQFLKLIKSSQSNTDFLTVLETLLVKLFNKEDLQKNSESDWKEKIINEIEELSTK